MRPTGTRPKPRSSGREERPSLAPAPASLRRAPGFPRGVPAPRSRGALAAGLVMALLAGGGAAAGEPPPASAEEIKAAYVFNFAKFVEWPPGLDAEGGPGLQICVLSGDAFLASLETLVRGRDGGPRPLVVRPLTESTDHLESCRVLFVESADRELLRTLLRELDHLPILTVGEADSFLPLGGMIRLSIEESKVRFTINVDAAGRSNLKLSARLLSLARVVTDHDLKGH